MPSKIQKTPLILWTAAMAGYFFQFPFSFMAALIAPCGIAYVVVLFREYYLPKSKVYLCLFALFFGYLVFSVIRSVTMGTQLSRVLRFGAIIVLLPVCCLAQGEFEKKWRIFLNLAAAKSAVLVALWLWLLVAGDHTAIRSWAQQHQYGDIYLLSRWNPKVQVQGNALLVLAFMVDYARNRKFTLQNGIVLAGCLAAGNFAFVLGLAVFFAWQGGVWVREKKISKAAIGAVLVCGLILGVPYVVEKISQKAEVSNKTRIEQAQVLLNANPVIGEGLGNYIQAQTPTRIYDGDIYFELQTLYIYNQVGLLGLGLVYCLTVFPLWRKSKKRGVLYLIYLVYSFWNPYCWDMTHIFALLILMNTKGLGEEHDKSDCYSLLSVCQRQSKH